MLRFPGTGGVFAVREFRAIFTAHLLSVLGGVFAAAQGGLRQPRVVLELPFGSLMHGGARLQLGHSAAQRVELGGPRCLRVRGIGHGPTIAQDARLVSRRRRCRTLRPPDQRSDPR